MELANKSKQDKTLFLLLILTAMLITATGIIFHQLFLYMLPLYVSCVIYVLQAKINRIAYLIGALNSLLYAFVYVKYSLYASAVNAVCISFTVQIITYFLWKSKPRGNSTELRSLKWTWRILIAVAYVVAVILSYRCLRLPTESEYKLLDLALSTLGFVSPFLTMFAFIEYAPLMVYSQILSICLYITMLPKHPEQSTYLVFSIYGLVCQTLATKNVLSAYKKQQKEKLVN